MLLLHQFGGLYLDTDVITLRSIQVVVSPSARAGGRPLLVQDPKTGLVIENGNFLVSQDADLLNGAVMQLGKAHPFLKMLLGQMVSE